MTQVRIIDAGCNEVADLMHQVNDLPDFSLLVTTSEPHGFPTLTQEHDKPEGVSDASWELVQKLKNALDKNLIDSDGQNSDAFYDMKHLGFYTSILARDSFGPLACAVHYPNNTWRAIYG